ncbi:mandelate racemase/muconate lactonizing enzyme family protein, partial [Acinetobacter baumannii]
MKIKRIELYQIDLPYSGGVYHLSGGREYRSFDASIVKIIADNGLEGWGESTPFGSTYIASHALGARAGIAEIAPHLLGKDPRQVDRINETMDNALVGHNHAKSALDLACWDLFGKSVNLPVCELLGGSTGRRLPVISSIHADTPD